MQRELTVQIFGRALAGLREEPAMPVRPEEALANMIASLKEKTGRSMDDWRAIVAASRLAKHGEIVKLLKEQHGVSHGYANQIALQCLKSDAGQTTADPVDELYAGPKSQLRPIHEAIM